MRIAAGILMIIVMFLHGLAGVGLLLLGGLTAAAGHVADESVKESEKKDKEEKKKKKDEEKKDEAKKDGDEDGAKAEAAKADKETEKEVEAKKKEVKEGVKEGAGALKKLGGIVMAIAGAYLLLAALELAAAIVLFMEKAKGFVIFVGGLGIALQATWMILTKDVPEYGFDPKTLLGLIPSVLAIVAAFTYKKAEPPQQMQQGYPGGPPP